MKNIITKKEPLMIETTSEFDVKEKVKETIAKAVQEVTNQCSKDYFRNIKVSVNIEME